MTIRQRADRLLVERGLFESRARAQAAIAAGRVIADGLIVRKASEPISVAAAIEATPEHPYVSRGGIKLAAALDSFSLEVSGRVCLDVGASTGGFTQVLIARGARRVYAVDVGRDQLHPSLRGRDEIVSIEGADIRTLDPSRLPELTGLCDHRRELHLAEARAARHRKASPGPREPCCSDQAAVRNRTS